MFGRTAKRGLDGYPEDSWLALSGIQHFAFCPRQWALIHVEQQWVENYLTTAGLLEHKRVHDYQASEKRGDLLILRDLRVFSRDLGISGDCDVVEFHADDNGVSLEVVKVCGARFQSNTSMANRKTTTLTGCNFVPRRCVWRKCWHVT